MLFMNFYNLPIDLIFLSLGLALLVEIFLGWPDRVFALLGHPVIWAGRAIATFDHHFNKGSPAATLFKGGFVSLFLITLAALFGFFIQTLIFTFSPPPLAPFILALFIWPMLAVRSMDQHVRAILLPLQAQDLPSARKTVSQIVGRDPAQMDENAIRRATIESVAENSSDALIAPLFWGVLLGLPGLYAYKMINTLDSMIGYRDKHYMYFGKLAARIDDGANYLPARLTAILYALIGRNLLALCGLRAQARHHRSVNAGWPEGVMAHLLKVRLSGPRHYAGRLTADHWLNAQAPDPSNQTLETALHFFHYLAYYLCASLLILYMICAFWRHFFG